LDIEVRNISHQITNGFIQLFAEIANIGTHEVKEFEIKASVGTLPESKEKWHGLLKPGETFTYTFNSKMQLSSNSNFYCVEVIKPNGLHDDYQLNNSRCRSLTEELYILSFGPNPGTENFTLELNLPAAGNIDFEFYDDKGSLIKNVSIQNKLKGYNKFHFSSTSLGFRNGIYNCRIKFQNEEKIFRFLKF